MKNELTTKVTPEMESIAMAPPLLVEIPGNVTESSFRFWTVPPSAASPKTGESTNPYEGSFVMMSPSGLKAIEGRVFFLNSGHILAYSKAKSIVIVTAVARVSVEPGAAAYVEIVKPGLTRVRVLECKKGEHGVSVKFKTGGKAEEIRLSADEDLLTAEHKLDDSDKSLQAKSSSGAGTTGGGDNWSKTNFSMKSLFDSNQFFSTDLQCQNAEQRSAIMQLRKRIK